MMRRTMKIQRRRYGPIEELPEDEAMRLIRDGLAVAHSPVKLRSEPVVETAMLEPKAERAVLPTPKARRGGRRSRG